MPGTVFPTFSVRPTKSRAESTMHALLKKHLPEGWVAWHSFRFACATSDGANLREIDFVIFVPNRGLIAMEIKGGATWEIRDGQMQQDSRSTETRDPLEQVIGAKKAFVRELRHRLGPIRMPWVAHMVVFPDVPGYDVPTGYGYENVTLLSGQLAFLADALEAFADREFAHARPPHDGTREILHSMWCERWVPSLQARDVREARPKELFVLSGTQRTLAQRLEVKGSLLITGGPGSGKSIVARESALRWAEQGKRVFYFCYTIALAQHMREAGVLESHPIREYMKELVERANGGETQDASDGAAWAAILHEALALDVSHLERPDVIVVDEAQDLGPEDWQFLDRMRRDDTALLALGDAHQSFLPSARIPKERFDVVLGLEEQHRSPAPVLDFADLVRAAPVPSFELSEHLRIRYVQADETQWQAVEDVVSAMRGLEFRNRDIAILSLRSKAKMTRPSEGAEAGLRPVDATHDDARKSLILDTALRFKGLERPWIIITDLGPELDEKTRVRLYVALTRCTVGVTLVLREEERGLFEVVDPSEYVADS